MSRVKEMKSLLNWIMKKDNIIPIPGAKSIDQVKSNIEATKFQITDKEYNELAKLTRNIDLWMY